MTYEISMDCNRLDLALICRELHSSYWAKERTPEQIAKSLEHSLCFGVFTGQNQVGFARVVTDQSTFAYLCDVFVIESERGKGVARLLMKSVLNYKSLRSVGWTLRTRDAHGLYEKFGFATTTRPERYMERQAL
jgi:GNAT superfamily N-acetyltransferase